MPPDATDPAAAARRTAILHFGSIETGAGPIRRWLRQNAQTLGALGYHVALGAGGGDMPGEAAPAGTGRHGDALARWTLLAAQMRGLPATAHSVIVSSEMLHGDAVEGLKHALDPCVRSYRIIVYLRRQDEVAVARFDSRVQTSATPLSALLSEPIDYAQLLADYGKVFGRDNLMPRLFASAQLHEGDIVADFAHALGLPAGAVTLKAKVKEQRMTPAAQTFFMQLYAREAAGRRGSNDLDEAKTMMMSASVSRRFAGPGIQPTRAEAAAFVDAMAPSNEAVRGDWFPQMHRLFSDDFTNYPQERAATPTPEEVLEVAVAAASELLTGRRQQPRGAPTHDDGSSDVFGDGADCEDEVASSERSWNSHLQLTRDQKGQLMKDPEEKPRGERMKGESKERRAERGEKREKGDKGPKIEPKIEPKIVNKTARTLWRIANQKKLEGVAPAERRTQYAEQKAPFVDQARKLLRTLRKDGVEFTLSKEGDAEGDLARPLAADKEPAAG